MRMFMVDINNNLPCTCQHQQLPVQLGQTIAAGYPNEKYNLYNMSAQNALALLIFLIVGSINLCFANSSPPSPIDVVIGVDGGTESIRACCFNAQSGQILGQSHAVPYVTSHPHPGWAEQSPTDWYDNMVAAVRRAVDSLPSSSSSTTSYNIRAICCDTTCCSVVALAHDHTPLRPCLLWMDARSATQAKQIMDVANEIASSLDTDILKAFPELRVNCNGEGPISAEWLLPKAMWIKQHEPDVYENAEIICEYQDYLNYRLTGKMVASGCNVAARWHHDGWDVLEKNHDSDDNDDNKGRPMKLYEALGMKDLAAKLPKKTLAMGDVIGTLTEQAAIDLNLPKETLVVQGGPDAFVGMIGLGTIRPGQLCLITGSSHLHCLITKQPTSAPGTWGAYRGAPLADTCFAEGGQSSTGSLVRWVRDLVSGPGDEKISYKVLDDEAAAIPPGSDGLVALETWQGSRTPHTDPLARGSFAGLTLAHSRAHMFRSILEAVCYGTRACFDALESAASQSSDMPNADEVVIAGGATRSPLWLQLHADVTGRSFLINENTDGPLLGCAILASVGAGIHASVDDAVENMIRRERKIEPREDVRKVYDRLYKELYLKLRPGVKEVFHAISEVRGGDASEGRDNQPYIISPSLLAADWSDMKGEVQKCIDAGVSHLHVDVFDGVYLDSPYALTFGPQMVSAIRKRFVEHPELVLDIHLCVDRPARYAVAMAESGASRVIFMFEALRLDEAVEFAQTITSLGMSCGVSINPDTSISDIYPLLETGLVDLVDILAVEPGFGGQEFNPVSEHKIKDLQGWRQERGIDLQILVDGGINSKTIKRVVQAGADICVAGTAIFRHKDGFSAALKELHDQ